MAWQPSVKKVAVIGFGNVGRGVISILLRGEAPGVELSKIVVKHRDKPRPFEVPSKLISTDLAQVIKDPEVDIVVELIGGIEPARTLIIDALQSGKDVVTTNKVLIAEHGTEIFSLASQLNQYVGFRGTFVGCHSLIHELSLGRFATKRIKKLRAILNGTCNYILSAMTKEGKSFQDALCEAQQKGYAESDPSEDIDGIDTARKIRILLGLINNTFKTPAAFPVEGIRNVTIHDIQYAKELGYKIKLLGMIEQEESYSYMRVQPMLVPQDSLLGSVEGVDNAIEIEDEYGIVSGLVAPGAGTYPTATAVIKDLLDIANGMKSLMPKVGKEIVLGNISDTLTRCYLRVSVVDQPGVLAQISKIFAEHDISIAAVIQKESRAKDFVPIVITTHSALERNLHLAIKEVDKLSVVKAKTQVIRILDTEVKA